MNFVSFWDRTELPLLLPLQSYIPPMSNMNARVPVVQYSLPLEYKYIEPYSTSEVPKPNKTIQGKMKPSTKYHLKGLLFFIVLAIVTFGILYATVPKRRGPAIRVLYSMAKDGTETFSEFQINPEDNSVIIDKQNLDSKDIMLECSSQSPVTWTYKGYGTPSTEIENERRFTNFNDSSTYTFISSLRLEPLVGTSSGKYICATLEEDSGETAFVQVYIPDDKIFVNQNDLTISSTQEEGQFIPCPLTDPRVKNNVTLMIFRDDIIQDEFIQRYDPAEGFYLNAKFLEEKEPLLSTFVCLENASKKKSGKININLKSDSAVTLYPPTDIVLTSPFNGTFSCESPKDNLTLRFRKIQKLRPLQYRNPNNIPGAAGSHVSIQFEESDLKDGSTISCVSSTSGKVLHTWNVFKQKSNDQNPSFSYSKDSEEFRCCGLLRPSLTMLSCDHPTLCNLRRNCFTSSSSPEEDILQTCYISPHGDEPFKTFERPPCTHYKVDHSGKGGGVSSGRLKCRVGLTYEETFQYLSMKMDNGTVITNFIRINKDTTSTTPISNIPPNIDDFLQALQPSKKLKNVYQCKGSKFYFSKGFLWQILRSDGFVEYKDGKDRFEDSWIISEFLIENEAAEDDQANYENDQRQKFRKKIKKIHCIAPLWNHKTSFVLKTFIHV